MAGALCIGTAAFAQSPTPQPPKDSTSTQTTTTQTTQSTESTQQSQQAQPTQPTQQPAPDASAPAYRKDMTQVQSADIPTGLRSTLDRPQFKGWENGAVYSNVDKSVFIVEIKDETEGRTKAYRFDANGKPITNE
jgi:hypothetical protein